MVEGLGPPLLKVVTEVRILYTLLILRDRAEVARKAHNLEVTGSIPVPATNDYNRLRKQRNQVIN
jgi:hypothetical protein